MTGSDIVRQTPYTDGKININVATADTSGATSGKKVYYIKVLDEGGKVVHFGKGVYEIVRT